MISSRNQGQKIYCLQMKYFTIVKLLALALTNLVLGLANMVNNLVKPSLGQPHHQPDQNLALILTTLGPGVDTIIKQATTPQPPPPHHQ